MEDEDKYKFHFFVNKNEEVDYMMPLEIYNKKHKTSCNFLESGKYKMEDAEKRRDELQLQIDKLHKKEIEYCLCSKPCQFVEGKTQDTLNKLKQRHNQNLNEHHHLIQIVVTNKSLQEVSQWELRTSKEFKNDKKIKIHILSSKSKDYKDINSYIADIILKCEDKSELPDILIMCFHSQRVVNDLVKMINIFGGKTLIFKIKFHISFDEPDSNLGVSKKFLESIKDFIDKDIITGICWITATPLDPFWKMLKIEGITTLLNMNYNTFYSFDEDLKNYQQFKEHNIIEFNNETKNPLDYIKDIYKTDSINKNERKIVFAPGHIYTKKEDVGSHKEIIEYFKDLDYCIFILNGTEKGFYYPNSSDIINLETFNKKYNITGELRESLVKWNQLNPKMNLAITGNNLIERGITFNTTGFNFTDMIFSTYHLYSISKLIQLAGRGSGGKQYVGKMNVFCTTKIKDTIIEYNEKMTMISSLNPRILCMDDFKPNNTDTIPIKMIINDDETLNNIRSLMLLNKNVNKKNKEKIHNILIDGIEQDKITIIDKNNIKKFVINTRQIDVFRKYREGGKKETRRYKKFNDNHDKNEIYGNYSKKGNTYYNIDCVIDKFIYEDFTNETNVFWISYIY